MTDNSSILTNYDIYKKIVKWLQGELAKNVEMLHSVEIYITLGKKMYKLSWHIPSPVFSSLIFSISFLNHYSPTFLLQEDPDYPDPLSNLELWFLCDIIAQVYNLMNSNNYKDKGDAVVLEVVSKDFH